MGKNNHCSVIVQIIFQEAQVLDITGPAEVFSQANKFLLKHRKVDAPAYEILLVAPDQRPVATSSGIKIIADATFDVFNQSEKIIDTLIVSGGAGVHRIKENQRFIDFVLQHSKQARRIASICTGTFALARTGLLDGKTATTHWTSCEKLAAEHPAITVEPDMIYTRDGNIYSSAGITAGIDLAMALVEEDFGRELALEIAKQLVVFMKRQGGQSQFSTALAGQYVTSHQVQSALDWLQNNPGRYLSLEQLSHQCGMSQRNFSRIFKKEIGMTPGKYVEKMRVEFAAQLIETCNEDLLAIAEKSGFLSVEKMRRAFKRQLRVLPHVYRKRFGR